MTSTERAEGVEVVEIRRVRADVAAVAVEFVGDAAAFVLSEESVLMLSAQGGERRIALHAGAVLCATGAGSRLISGGDDGRLVAVDEDGEVGCLFADERARWIDHVAAGPEGDLAWSIGKQVYHRDARGSERIVHVPSSVGGLAFSAGQMAIAHYNGVTLFRLQSEQPPRELMWKGSHTAVCFSCDAKVLVTAMREPALHAWNLATGADIPMPTYPTIVSSMDCTADGRFLATSGSDRLVLVPFQDDDNPLTRMPLLLAPYRALVAVVSCHPQRNIVAVGYADGLVMLVRIPDGAEILIKAPDAHAITAMRWDSGGHKLAIAAEDGRCEVVSLR